MFVIDSNAEEIAVSEARRMGVPVVSVVDTNCDPDQVDWIIPGNDDALRAIRLFTSKISDSVIEGHNAYEQSQIAEQKAARIRRWRMASSTWIPASTSSTRSRKAISSRARKLPPPETCRAARTRRSHRSAGRGIALINCALARFSEARRFRHRDAPGLFAGMSQQISTKSSEFRREKKG